MDNINAGDVISIRHYSGVSPFKSIVLDVDEQNYVIHIKLTKDFAIMNFLEGDPVVIGYQLEEKVFIFGGNIGNIQPREAVVEIKVDKVEAEAEQRKSERHPVSLYADVRAKDDRKKYLATIKDMSYYGMLIYSKANYEQGQDLEVDIFMDKTMIFLKANIVRKTQNTNYFEYGVGIRYEDSNSLTYMKDYIKRLVESQEQLIRKLKNTI
ncbi:MAG: PilZ domain-containing protein [Clostridia bacterium]|nr:PilZ domain-containing protein [Clostridia bacterium]